VASPVKVTVIGAGSVQFSLGVVKDLCLTENLAGSHVTLMDINAEKLETIHRLAERYVRELGGSITFDRTTDRQRALKETDYIINTAGKEHMPREGRNALRGKYKAGGNFPIGYMYNLPLMLSVAKDVEAICPNAWLIQSGNPVREGTPLITRETGVKVIGLCHGHYGYMHVARVLGLDPDKVTWTAPGLNHCIWLTEFRYEGKDAYPLLDDWITNGGAEAYWADRAAHPENYGLEDHMSRVVIDQYRKFGLLPIGDTTRGGGWWYKTDIDTRVHWYGPYGGFGSSLHAKPWQESLAKRWAVVQEAVDDPKRSLLEAFPPVKTREQQVPIIDALANDVPGKFQINVPNQGALPGVADHMVVELPAIIDKGGIHRLQLDPLPRKLMLEVIQPHVLSTEWEVEAYVTGDAEMLVDALLTVYAFDHGGPTVSYADAKGYVEELLSLPDEQDWAAHFKWNRPAWGKILDR
jgi:alpha-galactosidase